MKDEVDYMNGFTKYWNRPDRAAYLFLTPSFLVLLLADFIINLAIWK